MFIVPLSLSLTGIISALPVIPVDYPLMSCYNNTVSFKISGCVVEGKLLHVMQVYWGKAYILGIPVLEGGCLGHG